MKKNKDEGSNSIKAGVSSNTWLVLGISVIYILFGLGMLLIDILSEEYIIYVAGIVLIVYGAVLVIKYFIQKSYKEIGKYGFSIGAVLVLIGVCVIVRARDAAPFLILIFGVCVLCTAVVKLQNALDMKCLKNKGWIPFLIIALVFIAAGIIILLDPNELISAHNDIVYIILIADGAASILSTVFLFFAIRRSKKKALIEKKEETAAANTGSPRQSAGSESGQTDASANAASQNAVSSDDNDKEENPEDTQPSEITAVDDEF